jgi:hypothetical protein
MLFSKRIIPIIVFVCIFLLVFPRFIFAQELFKDRFFAECPGQAKQQVFKKKSYVISLQRTLYSLSNLMELEIIRIGDWLVDVPFPGPPRRPLESFIDSLHYSYNRLGNSRPIERFGEFADALQIPELSLGDISGGYAAFTGGSAFPGSGMIVRFNKLTDWAQNVGHDVNSLFGIPFGKKEGLVNFSFPAKSVDSVQAAVTRIFHSAQIILARTIDFGVSGIDKAVLRCVGFKNRRSHAESTVFFRMPVGVYRANELWFLEHGNKVYAGTKDELSKLNHASIFHIKKMHSASTGNRKQMWYSIDRFMPEPSIVIAITDERTASTAPKSLLDYLIPVDMVMEENPLIRENAGKSLN